MDESGSDDDNFVQMYYGKAGAGTVTTTLSASAGSTGDGTLRNQAQLVSDGYKGGALELDGNSDTFEISSATNHAVRQHDEFTVSAWIYREGDAGHHEQIWRDQVSNGSSCSEFNVRNSGSQEDKLGFYISGGPSFNANTALAEQTWYHAVFRYDGSVGKIFLNGVDECEQSRSEKTTNSVMANAQFY